MAQDTLPPPPINDKPGSFTWLEWYRQLRNYVSTTGSVPWYVINFAGSNITDISLRAHADLQGLQGGTAGERYHLTAAQHASLSAGNHNDLAALQGGTVTERYHMSSANYDAVSRLSWNSSDGTMNINMGYGGASQQVGMEQYVRIYNNTGSTILNGRVVGYAGAASGEAHGQLFIANGTTQVGYFLGVSTMDIPNGTYGYITISGHVHQLNTSAFSAGDGLYVSPTVAGGFTNVRPLAPNVAIPVGIVLTSDAINGIILVRPVVSLTMSSGIFYDTTTQTLVLNTPKAITFNSTYASTGFSIGTPTSRIVAARAGTYNFKFSLQVGSTSSSSVTYCVWPRVNGTDIPNSATNVTIKSNTDIEAPSWDFTLNLNAGDYFELIWAADSSNVSINASSAQVSPYARPAIPSVILTVTQLYQ